LDRSAGLASQRLDRVDADIAAWQELVEQNPTSRHAHLGLAKLLNVGVELSVDAVRLGRALRRASQPRFRT